MLMGYLTKNVTPFMRFPVSKCPLREGGSPKGGGWIRLKEAGSAKQIMPERWISHIEHLTFPSIHPAALPRPFSQGLHAYWIFYKERYLFYEVSGKQVPP